MKIEREESFNIQISRKELEVLYHLISHIANEGEVNKEEDSIVADFIDCIYCRLYP